MRLHHVHIEAEVRHVQRATNRVRTRRRIIVEELEPRTLLSSVVPIAPAQPVDGQASQAPATISLPRAAVRAAVTVYGCSAMP